MPRRGWGGRVPHILVPKVRQCSSHCTESLSIYPLGCSSPLWMPATWENGVQGRLGWQSPPCPWYHLFVHAPVTVSRAWSYTLWIVLAHYGCPATWESGVQGRLGWQSPPCPCTLGSSMLPFGEPIRMYNFAIIMSSFYIFVCIMHISY